MKPKTIPAFSETELIELQREGEDRMNPLIIYHGNCPDGLAAAAITYCVFGTAAEYRAALYGDPVPDVTDRDVIVVDFSWPRNKLLEMKRDAKSLVVLDHHKTAQEDLTGLKWCTFDMERSGATLMWDYLDEQGWSLPARLFAEYAEDRDLWKFALPYSREVYAALFSEPDDLPLRAEIARTFLERLPDLKRAGAAMLRRDAGFVRNMVRQAKMRDIGGYLVPVVNASCLFAEVGEALCLAYPDAPFAAYYFDRADGIRQWGARSRNGFDVSQVAWAFGGGGHAAAAGWQEQIG